MFKRFKQLIISFFVRISGNIISKILGLVSLPFISRALGPEGYGDYNYIITLLSYCALLVNWGYSTYGIRETAKTENANSVVNNIMSARFTFGILSILISGVVFLFAFWHDNSLLIPTLIALGVIIAYFLNIDFYYYGRKRMLIPTVSQLAGQVVFVVLVIFFIKNPSDLGILILLYVSYQIFISLIMLYLYIRNNKIRLSFSIKEALESINRTFLLGVSGRIENLSLTYPILIIPLFFDSNYKLGLFSSAFLFFTNVIIIYQTIIITISPYVVELKSKTLSVQRKNIFLLLGFMLLVGILLSLFFLFFGEPIVKLFFGKSFLESVPLVNLICYIILPFWPITMVLGTVLIYYDFDKYYLKSTILSALLIVVLVPVLVHLFDIQGALYAIAIANFAVIIQIFYFFKNLIPGLLFSKARAEIQLSTK